MDKQELSATKSVGTSLKEKWAASRTRAKEVHTFLTLTAGKKELGLGIFSASVVMRQSEDGYVYFDTMRGHQYEIVDYHWDGPRYKTVSVNDTHTSLQGKGRKHTGIGGALVGTMIAPGIGTIIGHEIGKNRVIGHGSKDSRSVSSSSEVETDSPASITLVDVTDHNKKIIGFNCNSKLNIEIQNFNMKLQTEHPSYAEQIHTESGAIQLLKQYKELLDDGVITEEEFLEKKKQLLG